MMLRTSSTPSEPTDQTLLPLTLQAHHPARSVLRLRVLFWLSRVRATRCSCSWRFVPHLCACVLTNVQLHSTGNILCQQVSSGGV